MFGWFKRKPAPAIDNLNIVSRPETAEEQRARWDRYHAECEKRVAKLNALDRRGERLSKDTRVVWYQGAEAIITDARPLTEHTAMLSLCRNMGTTTWQTSSSEVVRLP